jgi:hypothetical protein
VPDQEAVFFFLFFGVPNCLSVAPPLLLSLVILVLEMLFNGKKRDREMNRQ